MRLRAGVDNDPGSLTSGGEISRYAFLAIGRANPTASESRRTATSNTSNILEDTGLLAIVPEPANAAWILKTDFCPGTIVLRALGPVVASN